MLQHYQGPRWSTQAHCGIPFFPAGKQQGRSRSKWHAPAWKAILGATQHPRRAQNMKCHKTYQSWHASYLPGSSPPFFRLETPILGSSWQRNTRAGGGELRAAHVEAHSSGVRGHAPKAEMTEQEAAVKVCRGLRAPREGQWPLVMRAGRWPLAHVWLEISKSYVWLWLCVHVWSWEKSC